MQTRIDGCVRFHVPVTVSVEEMAGWSPERIAQFFSGVAKIVAAARGLAHQPSVGTFTAWTCEECHQSGLVEHDLHEDVCGVVNRLRDSHTSVSPTCQAGVDRIRVLSRQEATA